jgi:FAD/FMN-containing dehydrogenase
VPLLPGRRHACGDRVTAFELMSRMCIDLVVRHIPNQRDPFSEPHPWYVLVELSDSTEGEATTGLLEDALGEAAAREEIRDAVIAASEAQRNALWQLRENIPESQKVDGVSIKHDVSVPVSRVPDMIEQASAQLAERFPHVRILAFGHVGDGNVHYNCSKAERQEAAAFFAQSHEVNRIVYDVVNGLNGSISAEHGLGVLKRDEIKRYKSELELDLMRTVKRALDPQGIMNPGKVL